MADDLELIKLYEKNIEQMTVRLADVVDTQVETTDQHNPKETRLKKQIQLAGQAFINIGLRTWLTEFDNKSIAITLYRIADEYATRSVKKKEPKN